jgi:hypothetical protein
MMLPAIFFIPFFGFGFLFYFLPSIVAFARSKRGGESRRSAAGALISDFAKNKTRPKAGFCTPAYVLL